MDFPFARKAVGRWSAIAGVAMLVAFATPVHAIEFIGFTDGCFGSGCTPASNSASTSASLAPGLTYLNSTFDVTTSGGFVAIGNAPGVPNVNNLGSFTLTGDPAIYTGNHFDL